MTLEARRTAFLLGVSDATVANQLMDVASVAARQAHLLELLGVEDSLFYEVEFYSPAWGRRMTIRITGPRCDCIHVAMMLSQSDHITGPVALVARDVDGSTIRRVSIYKGVVEELG